MEAFPALTVTVDAISSSAAVAGTLTLYSCTHTPTKEHAPCKLPHLVTYLDSTTTTTTTTTTKGGGERD